jgi:hypothetical protein
MTAKIKSERGNLPEAPGGLQQNVKRQVISELPTLPDGRPPKLSEVDRSGLKPVISLYLPRRWHWVHMEGLVLRALVV